MSSSILGNIFTDEGTLAGVPVSVVFPWKSRKLVITNDSTINSYTITILGQTLTLKPKETLTTTIHIGTVGLNGTGDYRVWVFG